MAARDINTPARNSTRSGAWGAGVGMASPGSAPGAGGGNLQKPRTAFTQSGGSDLNKGRLKPGTEVHHNKGTASLKQGSTKPSR